MPDGTTPRVDASLRGRPKVYVGASLKNAEKALRTALVLTNKGCDVTSTWLTLDVCEMRQTLNAKELEQFDKNMGTVDMQDVLRSDVVLLLSDVDSTSGGLHVELGLALAAGKRVVVVGKRPNVFYHVDQVKFFGYVENAVDFIQDSIHRTAH